MTKPDALPGDEHPRVEPPPGFSPPWLRSDRPLARLVVRPLEQFLRLEAGSAETSALIGLIDHPPEEFSRQAWQTGELINEPIESSGRLQRVVK